MRSFPSRVAWSLSRSQRRPVDDGVRISRSSIPIAERAARASGRSRSAWSRESQPSPTTSTILRVLLGKPRINCGASASEPTSPSAISPSVSNSPADHVRATFERGANVVRGPANVPYVNTPATPSTCVNRVVAPSGRSGCRSSMVAKLIRRANTSLWITRSRARGGGAE